MFKCLGDWGFRVWGLGFRALTFGVLKTYLFRGSFEFFRMVPLHDAGFFGATGKLETSQNPKPKTLGSIRRTPETPIFIRNIP